MAKTVNELPYFGHSLIVNATWLCLTKFAVGERNVAIR